MEKESMLPDKLGLLDFYDIVKVTEDDLVNIITQLPKEISTLYTKIKKVAHELKQLGFIIDFIPLPLSEGGLYWSDYAYDYLSEKHGKDYCDKQHMYFTFYLDQEGKNINMNKDIIINFSEMKKDMKEKVLNIFYNEIPNNFEWNGSNSRAMFIHIKDDNYGKVDFDKLKDNDIYPQLTVHVYTFTKDFDDLKELEVYKELNDITKDFDGDMSYGISDMEITINGINDNAVYDLYNKIESIINKGKSKDIKKSKRVKSYSATFYADENTYYTLEKSKYMRKNKKDLTMIDFIKKYKH